MSCARLASAELRNPVVARGHDSAAVASPENSHEPHRLGLGKAQPGSRFFPRTRDEGAHHEHRHAASHRVWQSDLPHDELQDELRHIRDLVFADLLRERGETSTELSEYDAVINEARAQLTTPPPHSASTFATACKP